MPYCLLRPALRPAFAVMLCTALLYAPALSAQPAASIDYASARLERRLLATRAAGPIVLDGALDEAAWAAAPVASGFLQNEPREGQPATSDTDVRVLYDDQALYFGVFAHDDEPSALVVSDLKKDFNTAASDAFLIVVDTFADQRNGFEFATNPAGAKWDAQMSNEGRESNANWDGIWDVRTRVGADGWFAEIRIPFRTLKFRVNDPQSWGLNFQRRLRRRNEESYWSPLPRIYTIDRVSLAGTLQDLRQLRPGRNLRVKPFVAASSSTVGTSRSDEDYDLGLDVKYGLTSGLTLDATVNTDFSQVEADEQQVNLTRFNLLFPEKRDFFLENSGIFQFGLPSTGTASLGSASPAAAGRQNSPPDAKLFFSRQIGLSDAGASIPILAGSRITGRAGRYAIGALNIQQRAQGPVPSTNFTAVRVDRSVLANSDIGVMLLNKDQAGGGYNRVAGVDGNFRFGQLAMGAYAVKTLAPQAAVPGSGEDFSTRANFNYQSRKYLLRGAYEVIGRRFRDELGFVPRLGVNHAASYGRLNVRPKWASTRLGIREIGPHFHFDQFDRRDGRGTESRYFDWHVVLSMNDSGFFEGGVNRNREGNVTPFTLNSARGVRIQPGTYDFNEYFVLYRSNNAARVSFETRVSAGDLYDGTRNGYAFAPTVRVNEHFNASVSLQINDIDLPAASYVSKLVATRVNYSLNTRVFLNALVQYNTDTRQWSSNVRFNVIHRPLSDIFLVYNERRLDTTGDLVDRAVIAKVTYLLAF
ncbi:MAG TPA: DUF5916 domain-containing protein [Vicinamibacterales bacterium]|nr:DUF5916 domain-containing protein [Vicinamibacterales bacterium]